MPAHQHRRLAAVQHPKERLARGCHGCVASLVLQCGGGGGGARGQAQRQLSAEGLSSSAMVLVLHWQQLLGWASTNGIVPQVVALAAPLAWAATTFPLLFLVFANSQGISQPAKLPG